MFNLDRRLFTAAGEGGEGGSSEKTVPYSRFKAVNDEKISLKSQIEDLEAQLVEAKGKAEEADRKIESVTEDFQAQLEKATGEIESLKNEKDEAAKKLNDELAESRFQYKLLEAGANDKEYLEFLVSKKIDSFEGEEDAFENIDAILESVKEDNPDLFKPKREGKTPGGAPGEGSQQEETLTEQHLRLAKEKGLEIGI